MLAPGSTIGIFGSGQLGRMLALAAKPLGFKVHVFGPEVSSPAGQVADFDTVSRYDDRDAVDRFARACDVVTFEFENIPLATIEWAEAIVPVRPSSRALHVAQHRVREKALCFDLEIPVPYFAAVDSLDSLVSSLLSIGTPAVLKTTTLGYDGKGQARINTIADATTAWQAIHQREAIVESFVDFEKEISVIGARGVDNTFTHFGVMENVHAHHVLDTTIAPARITDQIADYAVDIAERLLDELGVVGVSCVEMFLTRDGELLVNEIAPRVHNSGHLTIDAAATSQFEQHVRAICGMPLGETTVRPSAMVNLLGDLWAGGEPDWTAATEDLQVRLHLYGKSEARPGRKMGHITALGKTADEALARAVAARARLARR